MNSRELIELERFKACIFREVVSAKKLHPPINSAHEGYAVILEELDEFKEWVWKKSKDRDPEKMYEELVQIAAMAARTAIDVLKNPEKSGEKGAA